MRKCAAHTIYDYRRAATAVLEEALRHNPHEIRHKSSSDMAAYAHRKTVVPEYRPMPQREDDTSRQEESRAILLDTRTLGKLEGF
jgi:hypothetical protein